MTDPTTPPRTIIRDLIEPAPEFGGYRTVRRRYWSDGVAEFQATIDGTNWVTLRTWPPQESPPER